MFPLIIVSGVNIVHGNISVSSFSSTALLFLLFFMVEY